MRRSLSQISFNLLLPAMSFYNIAAQVSADTIGALWPFAANAVLRCGAAAAAALTGGSDGSM